MLKVALRSAWTHKLRLLFTMISIVLGVTFMTGVLILGDTIDRVFDDLFATGFEETDALVQGMEVFDAGGGFESPRHPLDISVVETVSEVDGVEAAVPFLQSVSVGAVNQVLDADGEQIGQSGMGPPTLLEAWIPDEALSPYAIADGRPPAADDEVAINVAAVDDAGLALGDTITVLAQDGPKDYELVGSILFGTAESGGGATSVDFTLAEAQRLAGLEGQTQQIVVRGDGSMSDAELVDAIADVLPDGTEAITGQEAIDQLSQSVTQGFQFFQILILVFVAIAVIVGSFIIYNTFAILVAQRTRELALLRAIGASRRQVFSSVVFEAAVVGLVATVVGIAFGIALANGIVSVLEASGLDSPTSSLIVRPATVIAAAVVGLGLTVVLSLSPARSATKVAPLAALRDVAVDRAGASRVRIVIGVLLLLGAAGALLAGSNDAPETTGFGAVLLIIGSIVVGPVLAGPTVRAIGVPLRALGVTARLATENAARSPKRTAATASALIIGVALVGFILIFGASAERSVTAEVERGFTGDFIVQASGSADFFAPAPIPPVVAEQVAAVDGVADVSALAWAQAQVGFPDGDDSVEFLTAFDPSTASRFFEPAMVEGRLEDLTTDGIIVDTGVADSRDLAVGDDVTVTGANGQATTLTIRAISDDLTFIGYWAIDVATYRELVVDPQLIQVIADLDEGVELDDGRARIENAIAGTPGLEVLDRDEWIGDLADQITGLLTFVTALLFMSVIIAAIGIINTLLLSIHERTRELGLLRAVGMARSQVFRSITVEAILIALLGTVIGLAIGFVTSRALVAGLSDFGLGKFSVPVPTLAVVVIGGAILGTVAALYPAWRATRIKILDAIATE